MAANAAFAVDASGQVGIGTITPGAKLEVAGQIKITGGSPAAGKVLTSDAAGLASWGSTFGNISLLNNAARSIAVQQVPTGTAGQVLTISAGNTTSGSTAESGGDLVLQAGAGDNQSVAFVHGGDIHIRSGANLRDTNPFGPYNGTTIVNGGSVILETGGANSTFAERMRITEPGNVGIGTTAPQATLDINGFMRMARNSSQPLACDAAHDGAVALTNTTKWKICVCDGAATAWKFISDGTACAW